MINCKESTLLSSKSLDTSLSISERIKQKIHFILCPPCNYFYKQIIFINKSIHALKHNNTIEFDENKKKLMQEKIDELN